jgi:hypothetical protein
MSVTDGGSGVVSLRLRIHLDWQDIEAYYAGRLIRIAARAEDGQRIVLPASAIRPYLRQSGVRGLFELSYERDSHRLIELRRLGD